MGVESLTSDYEMLTHFLKEYGPWCIGWVAWLYERRQTTLAHRQLNSITNIFLKILAHDRAAAAILDSFSHGDSKP